MSDLTDVITAFKSLQANVRLKEVFYLKVSGRIVKFSPNMNGKVKLFALPQAQLLNELGRTRERNACALQFRHLDHFHPTFHRSDVSAM